MAFGRWKDMSGMTDEEKIKYAEETWKASLDKLKRYAVCAVFLLAVCIVLQFLTGR